MNTALYKTGSIFPFDAFFFRNKSNNHECSYAKPLTTLCAVEEALMDIFLFSRRKLKWISLPWDS